MAIKQKVKYRVIKQSAEVGGKFYGVINNSDPFVPSVTMQQIIDYKKLHNYSASQLAALIEDVLQGAAELVARDGLPRNLSSLLKFEARIRGTFQNSEASVTDQKIYVSPRLLKDIKVDLNKADFEFTNENDTTAPRITSAALEFPGFNTWSVADAFKTVTGDGGSCKVFKGDLTLAGSRLCPDGWAADCKFKATVFRTTDGVEAQLCRLDRRGEDTWTGFLLGLEPSVASINAITVESLGADQLVDGVMNAWKDLGDESEPYTWEPAVGDRIQFYFERTLNDGSGSVVYTTKDVVLVA